MTDATLQANALLNEAIIYATQCHAQQLRKGTDMPYIVHPLEVMHLLYLMGADKVLLAAGVLHDVVEDTDATLADIHAHFGKEIADLVASHTEPDKNMPWKERRVQALAACAQANKREQMLVLADKLANVRSMTRDYSLVGNDLWLRFKRGFKDQVWYYHGGVDALKNLADVPEVAPFYTEFKALVYNLFGEPVIQVNDVDLADQKLVIVENEKTNFYVSINNACLSVNGEEIGSSDIGSDTYEFSIMLDRENTGKLLLKMRYDFGQAILLKDIFKNEICKEGRYFSFLRYCKKHSIKYTMESF